MAQLGLFLRNFSILSSAYKFDKQLTRKYIAKQANSKSFLQIFPRRFHKLCIQCERKQLKVQEHKFSIDLAPESCSKDSKSTCMQSLANINSVFVSSHQKRTVLKLSSKGERSKR